MACVALLAFALCAATAWASGTPTWGTGVVAPLPSGANTSPSVNVPGPPSTSVSCPSPGSCTAISTYHDSTTATQGALFSLSGGAWTGAKAPLPSSPAPQADPLVALLAVSCASAGNCSAGGQYTDSTGHFQGLLLNEVSGTWSALTPTLPSGGSGAQINSVSCPSAGNCTAVGTYLASGTQGLLLTETSGVWGTGVKATLPSPNASPGVALNSVSCPSAGNCSAVGTFIDSASHQQGVLLTESSGTWSAGVKAATPSNAASFNNTIVNSVSCVSPGNCAAVGSYKDNTASNNTQGLLLSQSGGTWGTGVEVTPPSTPTPASDPGVVLNSVSCPSVGNCSAVGQYSSGATEGLLLTESGGTWSQAVAPTLPANASTSHNTPVTSVACASAGNCTAVGSYLDNTTPTNHTQGLLLAESAGAWAQGVEATLPLSPAPATNPQVGLRSVSCASQASCSVNGTYTSTSSGVQGLLISTTSTNPALALNAPATGTAGTAIPPSTVIGTLSAAMSPIGTVTFTVFGPQGSPPGSCSSGGTTVGTATVSGNGTYNPSAAFTPPSGGNYWWYASYGGDATNNPAASICGAGMPETVVASSGGGGGGGLVGGGLGGGGPGVNPPAISAYSLSPTSFRAASSGGSVARAAVGTTVRYRLSEAARVTFTVTTLRAGRKHAGKCQKPSRANLRGRRCTRRVTIGLFTRSSGAGANNFRFTGRIRRRKLAPGRYTLLAQAIDTAGRKSGRPTRSFRIVR